MKTIRLSALILLLALTAGIPLLWWMRHEVPLPPLQGQVEMAHIQLASKVPGRVLRVHVREGEQVAAGTLLLELEGPELEAKLDQARSVEQGASALLRKAESGLRTQEIAAAQAQWEKARAATELAAITFERMETLHAEGVIPRQRRDEVEAHYKAAVATEAMASFQLELAREGAREEDKQAASARVQQAEGGVREVTSYLTETQVEAPIQAEVDDVLVRVGELAGSGMPLVLLVDTSDVWVLFQITEDKLADYAVGSKIRVDIPAIAARGVPMEITRIAVMPQFATWRATRSSRGFDVRTFEMRARFSDLSVVEGLRPGMSVLLAAKPREPAR
jgi:HlyD family secretion protein